ncbi:MAG TPA: hypothetical protein VGQ58_05660 [Candidatus Limnocylindrales bacterium]|nr:hypothetical protein [Candidatus Limnocylindrales bacterium]
MPFDFLRRRKQAAAAPRGGRGSREQPGGAAIRFDGLTEEWRLQGTMHIEGRLSEVLNRREAVPISDVSWAPIDGSSPFTAVPGLKSVDPYDLIIVLAGPASKPPLSAAEKAAYTVHRIPFDVAMEAPPFRIVGTVFLLPGTEPARLLDRGTEMFVPVVDAVAHLGDKPVSDGEIESILVNRFYLRAIDQIDKRTGQRPQKLPGKPLGGTSWQERS